MRRGHPIGAKLSRRDVFLEARHVAVVIRGQNEDLIDHWLRTKSLERRIALVVPGYIEALHVVARTDLVAFVPSRLISAVAKPLSLREVKPPLDPGIDEQFMFYPTRAQFDPGSVWLRNLLLQTGHGLDRPKRRRSEPARARAAREPLSQTRFVAPGAAVVSSLDTSQRRT